MSERPPVQAITQIVLTNKKILNYFKENKTVDPEKMFLFFIEFLEKLGIDINERMQATINSQILNKLSDIALSQERIYHTQNNLRQGQEQLRDHVDNHHNTIGLKLLQIKQEYLDELKAVHAAETEKSHHMQLEKVSTFMEKSHMNLVERMLDKTNLLLNELLPKNNSALSGHIEESIRNFQAAIHIKLDSDTNIKEYIHQLELKFHEMMKNIQAPMQQHVSLLQQHMTGQEKMQIEIQEFMNKYRNSSFKGQYGENYLFNILIQSYPSADVTKTTGQRASGDMILKRDGKPSILIENKDYTSNVSNDEIHKFIRDIDEQRMHGIFLSERSGIISKQNFQIDVHKGFVLVYIHNAEYSPEKIQMAVNMIDALHGRLDEVQKISSSTENILPTEVMNDIYKEYQDFVMQRDMILSMMKESNKKIMSSIEDWKFPILTKYLSSKFATNQVVKNHFVCEYCHVFTGTTKQSLSAHKRGCKERPL